DDDSRAFVLDDGGPTVAAEGGGRGAGGDAAWEGPLVDGDQGVDQGRDGGRVVDPGQGHRGPVDHRVARVFEGLDERVGDVRHLEPHDFVDAVVEDLFVVVGERGPDH